MLVPNNSPFWAKYAPRTGETLSLLAHGLDVAVVFRSLCDLDGIRRALNNSTETLLLDEHLDRLAVLAMLHDLGKANLGFQDKVLPGRPVRVGHIQELAPLFLDDVLLGKFLQSLPRELETWFSEPASADSYFLAIFSHHGRPVKFADLYMGNAWLAREKWWQADSSRDPFQAIAEISSFARKAFPRAFTPPTSPLPNEPRFHHRFAGLVMLADWLGSHNHWFPIGPVEPTARLERNRRIAPELLRTIGLDAKCFRPSLMSVGDKFTDQFQFTPLPLQAVVDKLDPHGPNTRLTIVESETGSGKTEAALNWFCKLFLAEKVDSLYFALPTRVAARELYDRVNRYIRAWFPDPECRPVTLLAVPGYAQVDGYSVRELLPSPDRANLWQEDQEAINLERYWAGERPKRFLAATIAVGTIDQALLSTVQTAHAHLRSVCLDRSLIVVDEVHASDIYMSRLLRGLLTHHLGVGGYAMLLSATLGARARNEYVQITEACNQLPPFTQATELAYPSLTLADGQMLATVSPKRNKRVTFDIRPWAFCPEKIVDAVLAPALKDGARVLVVLNTVARAIKVLRAIEGSGTIDESWLFRCQGQICPHHGRFAPADREILDKAVSARFGKGSLSGPVLLVGTQTLEQSLDIDADLLVTDLAPSDVLLQRIGRLHRHQRQRPEGYMAARCVVLVPEHPLEQALDKGEVKGNYKRIGYGSVYEDLRSLELTYRTIRDKNTVIIPADNRLLVESATHPEALDSLVGERWREHRNLLYGQGLAKEIAASTIANKFDQYFGQVEFVEAGRAVATRLGIDQLQLAFDRPVTSPFGKTLVEMTIPGHMAPAELKDEPLVVEEAADGVITFRCQDRRYRYSRYGLEVIE
ncbi:MAG: CRISPR-associated helicase Cas3' [Firmicutes bacterium]|nr:CRISPR-associated helicase Cas3' [Bacillota bacterium]